MAMRGSQRASPPHEQKTLSASGRMHQLRTGFHGVCPGAGKGGSAESLSQGGVWVYELAARRGRRCRDIGEGTGMRRPIEPRLSYLQPSLHTQSVLPLFAAVR